MPDPVGAEIRTCSPEAIAGQAWIWAAVGASNALVNQSRVRSLKASRDTLLNLLRAHEADPGRAPADGAQGGDGSS